MCTCMYACMGTCMYMWRVCVRAYVRTSVCICAGGHAPGLISIRSCLPVSKREYEAMMTQ